MRSHHYGGIAASPPASPATMVKQLEDSVELRSQLEDLRVEGLGDADGGADRGDDCGRGMLCCVQSHTRESVTGQRFTHRFTHRFTKRCIGRLKSDLSARGSLTRTQIKPNTRPS